MEPYVPLKTSLEIARIRRACRIVGSILSSLRGFIEPGISTLDIDVFCAREIERFGALPALFRYKDYPKHVCTSVNHIAAHGIPGSYALQNGDILTVDITLSFDGWHGDAAWTYLVGTPDQDARRLVRAAWEATCSGIRAAKACGRMGDIGYAVESVARKYGCSVVESFVGHGIGRHLHEEPMVMHTGIEGTGIPIVPGMVFTVEPILSLGRPEMRVLDDGWSVMAQDNSLCAQFEQTIAVMGKKTEILTRENSDPASQESLPPF